MSLRRLFEIDSPSELGRQRSFPELLLRGLAQTRTIPRYCRSITITCQCPGPCTPVVSFSSKSPVLLGPVISTVTVTEGGLAVDTSCRVLRRDGAPIPGRFAAGGVAQGGMRLSGHGLHIGWAIVSGRLAAQSATHRLPRAVQDAAWASAATQEAARR